MPNENMVSGNIRIVPNAMRINRILTRRRWCLRALIIRDTGRVKTGYEILQYSHCEGWINNLYDERMEAYVFPTLKEAIDELQEEYDDWDAEILAGEREKGDYYDISMFQIKCIETGKVFMLDLINGKVALVEDHCADKRPNTVINGSEILGLHWVISDVRRKTSDEVIRPHGGRLPGGIHPVGPGAHSAWPSARSAGNSAKAELRISGLGTCGRRPTS